MITQRSPFINAIIHKGFHERHAYIGGMFGAGIYFAENSSKSNQRAPPLCPDTAALTSLPLPACQVPVPTPSPAASSTSGSFITLALPSSPAPESSSSLPGHSSSDQPPSAGLSGPSANPLPRRLQHIWLVYHSGTALLSCPGFKSILCPLRQMLFCRVTLGKSFLQFSAMKMAHAPPGHHSVIGRPSAYPEYLITYQILKPEITAQSAAAAEQKS
ncbi:hypothetical protein F7725_012379 [Dissostichus mawsoni]|uniref:Poly [ADP-ribose] polymerase n=1 Tax=Dissostichus mawsoni TaxID=36200 RepID=A0A7J5YQD5_DISMA|nr:hypothetical protein F7725_012379 [Dissostichus mawsoni]